MWARTTKVRHLSPKLGQSPLPTPTSPPASGCSSVVPPFRGRNTRGWGGVGGGGRTGVWSAGRRSESGVGGGAEWSGLNAGAESRPRRETSAPPAYSSVRNCDIFTREDGRVCSRFWRIQERQGESCFAVESRTRFPCGVIWTGKQDELSGDESANSVRLLTSATLR